MADDPLRRLAAAAGLDPADPDLAVAAGLLDMLSSAATRRAYAGDLAAYFTFLSRRGVRPGAADRGAVQAFQASLVGAGAAPETCRRRLVAVRRYYREAIERGLRTGANPAERLDPVRGDGDPGSPALGNAEVAELLERATARVERARTPGERLRAVRDRLVLELLLLTALRSGELRAMRFEHLEERQGFPVLRVRGKGGKVAFVKLNPALVAAISDFREQLHGAGIPTDGTDPVIIGLGTTRTPRPERRNGSLVPISARALFTIVDRALAAIGQDGTHSGPHLLRRTSVTLVWQRSHDLAIAQRHARHAAPTTTEAHYIRPADELAETGIDHLDAVTLAPR